MAIGNLFYHFDVPDTAIGALVLLGCFYFPMAFLAVAMKDTPLAANPMIVIPAILKTIAHYLIVFVLSAGVFALMFAGTIAAAVAGGVALSTTDMSVLFISMGIKAAWAFGGIYLLTVTMRMLGLLYNSNKDKLGWF